LSPIGAAAKEPKKQPAWSKETILAEKVSRAELDASSKPKSLKEVNDEGNPQSDVLPLERR
jgi:hypothetical protein